MPPWDLKASVLNHYVMRIVCMQNQIMSEVITWILLCMVKIKCVANFFMCNLRSHYIYTMGSNVAVWAGQQWVNNNCWDDDVLNWSISFTLVSQISLLLDCRMLKGASVCGCFGREYVDQITYSCTCPVPRLVLVPMIRVPMPASGKRGLFLLRYAI